jgi:arylsulfatase
MATQAINQLFLETFKGFPPRQEAASFSIDRAMEKMEAALSSQGR